MAQPPESSDPPPPPASSDPPPPPGPPYLEEGLLAPGVIRLFGRPFEGLKLGTEGIDPASNDPMVLQYEIGKLRRQVAALAAAVKNGTKAIEGDETPWTDDKAEDAARKPMLARIYGFSYLGNYYKIANPPVFRVYGEGVALRPGYKPENSMDILGVEFKDEDFVEGIRMWSSDHLDVAVRIDITIGWLREVLLDPEMSNATNVTSSASSGRADVVGRDSGLVGRDSGLVGRDSGLVGRDSGFVGRSR